MNPAISRIALVAVIGMVISGCAGPSAPSAPGTSPGESASSTPKRITAAIRGSDPPSLNTVVGSADVFEELVSAGLVRFDDYGASHPELAEQVPTIENGQWRLLPGGRMETTWRLRDGTRWQDGTPLTTADLLFTIQVGEDKELGAFRHVGYDAIESVEATDPRTITVRWKQPFIDADVMFTRGRGSTQFALPLPKHLLEKDFRENKATFVELRHWTHEFVGSGAFKLKEWERGAYLILVANEFYALGRPKLDEIEVKFMGDATTLISNMLAGTVDLSAEGNAVSVANVPALQAQYQGGRIDVRFSSWIVLFPQFMNPIPTVVSDVRFRRALLHAIDRQHLSDTLMAGLGPIAHAHVLLEDPAYKDVEPFIVKYDYDPRRATQLLGEMGLTRGSDGIYRDARNEPIDVEVRAGGVDEQPLATAIADFWKQVGIATTLDFSTGRRTAEDAAGFRSFSLQRYNSSISRIPELRSSDAPRPENRFVGKNRPRYSNPEFDGLIERFVSTVPIRERNQVAGQLLHHLSDQLVQMGTIYNAETTMISNRLVNVVGRTQVTEAWNAHLWDLK